MTTFDEHARAASRDHTGFDLTGPSRALLLSGAASLAALCWAGLALLILT